MGAWLPAVLDDAGRRFGDRPAVVGADGTVVSYTQLADASRAAAAVLQHRGVRAGDLVALCLPSSPAHLAAYLGLARIGAVTVGVNRRLPVEQRRAVLDHLAPALLVTSPDLDVAAGAPTIHVEPGAGRDLLGLGGTPDDDMIELAPDPTRVVALVLTSGSTGVPRAATFTDAHLAAVAQLDIGDRRDGGAPMLASTELVHVGMVTKLGWYLRTGATLHLLERWRAEDALRVVVDHGITTIGAISSQVALLLDAVEAESAHDRVAHVESLVVGGGPSPPALVQRARAVFGATYSIRYSSTESGGVGTATAPDADDDEALHTVGRPRPGVELEVRDDAGRPLGPGEPGRVHLRSSAVMAGWWADPAATARSLPGDGWLCTDDLGMLDERGCLRLQGRVGGSWVRGGLNVHPEVVEAVLGDHPAVAQIAVVPREDPVMGHVGVAVVVPTRDRPAPTLADLRTFAAARLGRHELPEAVVAVDVLPRTATDKLDRHALRALI